VAQSGAEKDGPDRNDHAANVADYERYHAEQHHYDCPDDYRGAAAPAPDDDLLPAPANTHLSAKLLPADNQPAVDNPAFGEDEQAAENIVAAGYAVNDKEPIPISAALCSPSHQALAARRNPRRWSEFPSVAADYPSDSAGVIG
jgi:hypothetical protein